MPDLSKLNDRQLQAAVSHWRGRGSRFSLPADYREQQAIATTAARHGMNVEDYACWRLGIRDRYGRRVRAPSLWVRFRAAWRGWQHKRAVAASYRHALVATN